MLKPDTKPDSDAPSVAAAASCSTWIASQIVTGLQVRGPDQHKTSDDHISSTSMEDSVQHRTSSRHTYCQCAIVMQCLKDPSIGLAPLPSAS